MPSANLPLLISDLAVDEQPRTKLISRGASSLSDAELLAILLRTGARGLSAVDLARRLLRDADHDLHALARLRLGDLTRTHGMGKVKAMQLLAAFELGRRREASLPPRRPLLPDADACFNFLRPLLADLEHEEFHLLCLNRGNRLLGSHLISRGGTTATVVDAKIIFRQALQHGSVTGLVLAHNHPSGRAFPSRADIEVTQKLARAALNLDLEVVDHLIVAGNRFYSFAEHGLLAE